MADGEGLTGILGKYLAESPSPPDATLERAKVNLVHNLTVALAGRSHETVATKVAANLGGAGSTLISNGQKASPEWAALANAALMAVRSQDDTHLASTSHPGAPVMAAALAVAEEKGATGREFLEAVVLGYEILCRIGRDFDKELSARGFRAAAVWSGFGAAAAAARLKKLDAEASAHALALVSHQAGGLLQVWREGSAEFPFHLGFGARNGVVAADLAAAGATAGRFMLEGEAGMYAAFAGMTDAATEALDGLGTRWQIEEVSVKPFPCCAVLQGPMREVLRLHAEIAGRQIAQCTLSLCPFEATFPGVDNPGPHYESPTATKMSAQFCVAVGLLDGRLRFDDLDRLNDPTLLSLANKIKVVSDPNLTDRQFRITLKLTDGATLVAAVPAPMAQPGFEDVRAFAQLLSPEIADDGSRAERLVNCIERLEAEPDLTNLIKAIRAFSDKNTNAQSDGSAISSRARSVEL